jgi:hypothetical protein
MVIFYKLGQTECDFIFCYNLLTCDYNWLILINDL